MITADKMDEFKNGVEALDERCLDFIAAELDVSRDEISGFDDDEFNDRVYEPMCDIEIEEEMMNSDGVETERGTLAAEIVTILGNSLAEANGWIEEN